MLSLRIHLQEVGHKPDDLRKYSLASFNEEPPSNSDMFYVFTTIA